MKIVTGMLVVLLGLAVAVPAVAGSGDTSTQQMVLAASPQFLTRMQYLMDQEARVVLAETGLGATHACRALYARTVAANPATNAATATVMVAGGVNLAGTVTGTGNTADSTASDAAILSQIATFWTSLAGCDTGN